MDEASNTDVAQQEQVVSAAPETEASQENVSQALQENSNVQSDPQDRGWIKKLRRDRDEAVNKARMQDEIINRLMTNQHQHVQPSAPREDILQKIQGQEYVAGSEVAQALQQQREDFKRELDELRKTSEQHKMTSTINELKREYADFDDIVNPDTLALLDEIDPSTAQSIAEIKDPAKAARLAYKVIKSEGLVDKVPGARRAKEVEKRLDQNKKTVQTPQAFDKRPMAQAFRSPETKAEKNALWQETLKYASLGGGGY